MRLFLFADKDVGLETLKYLHSSYPEDIFIVVTTSENEIYAYAKNAGISVQVYNKENPTLDLEGYACDLGILAWWPYIISKPLMNFPKQGFINFHPSFLPFNRGKHYNFWAIVEEAPFGVSLHRVAEGIDTGDVISQRKIKYDWTDTGESLYNKARQAIVQLFKETYPEIREASIDLISSPQDLSDGSFHYASELNNASQLHLDEKYKSRDLLNLMRAKTFHGHPGCWFIGEDGDEYEVKIEIKRKVK